MRVIEMFPLACEIVFTKTLSTDFDEVSSDTFDERLSILDESVLSSDLLDWV